MSNRWSRRRRVIKRPPVCRSKTTEPKETEWPVSLHADMFWSLFHLLTALTTFTGTVTMIRVGQGPEYAALVADDQGNFCVISIFLANAPAQCTVLVEVTTGPATGVQFAGLTPGFNGILPWATGVFPLVCSDPFGTGSVDLNSP